MARALFVLLLLSSVAHANAPAPWAVCSDKQAGESCASIYYPGGVCVAECPEGKECLQCHSRPGYALATTGVEVGAVILGLILLIRLLRSRRSPR